MLNAQLDGYRPAQNPLDIIRIYGGPAPDTSFSYIFTLTGRGDFGNLGPPGKVPPFVSYISFSLIVHNELHHAFSKQKRESPLCCCPDCLITDYP